VRFEGQRFEHVLVEGLEQGPAPEKSWQAAKTPEQRIAAARALSIQNSQASNLFNRSAAYWKDFAGDATSAWDADRLDFLLTVLKVPGRDCIRFKEYDVRKAEWGLGDQRVSIAQVRSMIDDRIRALGISKPKVWEHFNLPFEERRRFETLSFEEQMAALREPRS